MDSKKKARWPPSRYCTLCFEVVSRTSIPASSIRRSSRSASNGIEGATFLTTSSMTEAPCGPTAGWVHWSRVGEREPVIIYQHGAIRPCPRCRPRRSCKRKASSLEYSLDRGLRHRQGLEAVTGGIVDCVEQGRDHGHHHDFGHTLRPLVGINGWQHLNLEPVERQVRPPCDA